MNSPESFSRNSRAILQVLNRIVPRASGCSRIADLPNFEAAKSVGLNFQMVGVLSPFNALEHVFFTSKPPGRSSRYIKPLRENPEWHFAMAHRGVPSTAELQVIRLLPQEEAQAVAARVLELGATVDPLVVRKCGDLHCVMFNGSTLKAMARA